MTTPQLAYTSIEDRNVLVLEELQQVYYIAARIRERLPQQIEMDDLVNAGVIGLIEATRNYDSTRNANFSTFAKFRIRGAILDSLRQLDWGSRTVRRKGRAIADTIASLSSSLSRQPTQEEIAKHLDMPLEELQSTLADLDRLYLVGQQVEFSDDASGGSQDLIESAPSRGGDNPFELCMEGEAREHLKQAVLQLSEREQLILSLYYHDEMTMREISEIVGVAVSRVSQLHAAALVKLRVLLEPLRSSPAKPNPQPATRTTPAAATRQRA